MPAAIQPVPSKITPPNYAAAVIGFAEALYGDKWQGDLSRFTGVSRRTLTRMVGAVRAGRDYPAAPQILAELHAKLSPITTALGAWSVHANPKG